MEGDVDPKAADAALEAYQRPATGEIDMRVASRIRNARLRAGMSQTALAQALGLSLQQVHKYETGRNRLGPARLVGVCEALNLNVDQLFDGGDGRDPASDGGTDRECLEMVRYFQALPEPNRRSLVGLFRAIAVTGER